MSTWLRKTKLVPGSAPGGYVWNTPEDLVEVMDDGLAAELLEIPDAGFVSVAAPEALPEPEQPTETGGDQPSEDEAAAVAKPARKAAASRAKTQVQE